MWIDEYSITQLGQELLSQISAGFLHQKSDIDVGMLTTDRPGVIVYEDEFQVVAESHQY